MEPWILTYRNKHVYPLNMTTEMVDIEDIFHALALVNRYTGHTTYPYSVAQHSMYVSQILEQWGEPPKVIMKGLFHDAPETYISDIAGPIKSFIYVQRGEEALISYSMLEDQIHGVICEALKIEPGIPAVVKAADRAILGIESAHLMPHAPWTKDIDLKGAYIKNFVPMAAHNAESLMRARYYEITGFKPEDAWKDTRV